MQSQDINITRNYKKKEEPINHFALPTAMPFEPSTMSPQVNFDQSKIMISRKKINFKSKNPSDHGKYEQ